MAASLLLLYRISGVPSFLIGLAVEAVVAGFAIVAVVAGFAIVAVVAGLVVVTVVAGFAVVAVVAGFAVVATLSPFGFLVPVAWVVWAKLNPVNATNRLTISTIFFMFQWCFLVK